MNKLTEILTAAIRSEGTYQPQMTRAYANVIASIGEIDDVEQLLKCFLENPTDTRRAILLDVIAAKGNYDSAAKLFQGCRSLINSAESGAECVLHTLGKMRFEPVVSLLRQFALESDDYYYNKAAVLGMLHFSCKDDLVLIEDRIRSVLGQNTFPEFLPALVCKLDDKRRLLDELFVSGENFCSTDCNAGIILGIALSGIQGEKLFSRLLFNRNWEPDGSSTGTAYWVYAGTILQNIEPANLFQQIADTSDEAEQRYRCNVLYSLIKHGLLADEAFPFSWIDYSVNKNFPAVLSALSRFVGLIPALQDSKFLELQELIGSKMEAWLYSRVVRQ